MIRRLLRRILMWFRPWVEVAPTPAYVEASQLYVVTVDADLRNLFDADAECPICYEPMRTRAAVIFPACGHPVCMECFRRTRGNQCCLCRREIFGL